MAIRVSIQAIIGDVEAQSEVQTERRWKLFLLLPRMLLFRPDRGGVVPREKLEVRITQVREHRMRDERSFVIGQGQEVERFRRSQEGYTETSRSTTQSRATRSVAPTTVRFPRQSLKETVCTAMPTLP